MLNQLTTDVFNILLTKKIIRLNFEHYFTWSSGLKAPLYIDNRLLYSFVEARQVILKALSALVQAKFPTATCLMGTAVGGIIPATAVAFNLNLPVGFVRSSQKKHGTKQQIEGLLKPDSQVVVIEDLLSTGQSVTKVVQALRDKGVVVLGVVSLFSYELASLKKVSKEQDFCYYSLVNIKQLILYLKEAQIIPNNLVNSLTMWYQTFNLNN